MGVVLVMGSHPGGSCPRTIAATCRSINCMSMFYIEQRSQ